MAGSAAELKTETTVAPAPKTKRRKKASPTQHTLKALRKAGWTCAIVEKWNAHIMIRQDLFGFIDILALRGPETLAVQTTDASSVSKRVDKILESPNLAPVLTAGWRVEVHGWKRPTKTLPKWRQRIVPITANSHGYVALEGPTRVGVVERSAT